MQHKYMARLFAPDGESVTDCYSDTVDGVWEQVNDMGSRWFFYPIPVVVRYGSNKSTGRIVAVCDGLEHWQGRTCRAFSKSLERATKDMPDTVATTRTTDINDLIAAI